jgi:hypothetical protein
MTGLSPQMLGSRPAGSRDPASLRPQPRRDGADFWPTPACLIWALIHHVLHGLPSHPLWEFAAGDGRVAKAMRAAGYSVFASDIEPRGDGIERHDFLRAAPPQLGLIAVSNGPYNQLDKFLARGQQLLDHGQLAGFVLLVRTDALTAASRADVFTRAAAMWVCCWRPVWIAGTAGNGRWSNAWIVWLPDHPGPPVTHWLRPERQQRQGVLADLAS